MPKERGQDRERIEVGDAFGRLALAQDESVDVGPFGDPPSDMGMNPELDEHQVPVPAPTIDCCAHVWKATPDALELGLCGRDPDRGSCEWLPQHHVRLQELGQSSR